MANCLYLHESYITKFDFMNYAFAKLVKLHGSLNSVPLVGQLGFLQSHWTASVISLLKGRQSGEK